MTRLPLQSTAPNSCRLAPPSRSQQSRPSATTSTMSRRGFHSMIDSGRENEETHPPSSSRRRSLSRRRVGRKASLRVKVLLGGVFDRLQQPRSSKTTASNTTVEVTPLLSSSSIRRHSTTPEDPENHPQHTRVFCSHSEGLLKSRTSKPETPVTSDTETSTRVEDDDQFTLVRKSSKGLNCVLDGNTKNIKKSYRNKETTLFQTNPQQHLAAQRLQALFRGYSERYHIRILTLQRQLRKIHANKERQLLKIQQRTQDAKKREKSVVEFQHERISRQLQRTTRIIPYLFREGQKALHENVHLTTNRRQLQQAQSSHNQFQLLAHSYLEMMEDIPGIWTCLRQQWMAPKKPRIRRGFGPDGKIIRLLPRATSNISDREVNTHDEDLPVSAISNSSSFWIKRRRSSSSRSRQSKSNRKELRTFRGLFASSSPKELEKAFTNILLMEEQFMPN